MQVGSVAEWLKRDGDRVEVGEPICMIAADKGTVELEAPESGILHISPRAPEVGVEVPVGTLLAYLVDHISIHFAFAICSAVSVFLVVSYLRLVVGMRFATREAAVSQFIYLVAFSYAFFLKGFTGLAIAIGSILTLFVVMQATGKIRWREKFSAPPPKPEFAPPAPLPTVQPT